MATLTGTIEELMTPRLLGRFASESGLPETKVKSGISGAVASILDGLVGKATDRHTMTRVVTLIDETPALESPERLVEDSVLPAGSGNTLLGIATGDASGLASRLASTLNIGIKGAAGLVSAGGSLAVAAFRRISVQRGGFDVTSLASTLIEEGRDIHARVPGALARDRSGMIGGAAGTASGVIGATRDVADAHDAGYAGPSATVPTAPAQERALRDERDRADVAPRTGGATWWWLLGLVAIALIAFALYQRTHHQGVVRRAPSTAVPTSSERDRLHPPASSVRPAPPTVDRPAPSNDTP